MATKNLLVHRINETFGVVIAFHEMLGSGGVLYNAWRNGAALRQIQGTGTNL
jgi:hypothetical protein